MLEKFLMMEESLRENILDIRKNIFDLIAVFIGDFDSH